MEVEIFTLADYAADYGQGKLVINGTFDNITAKEFPAIHPSCAIVARIRIANSELGSHYFQIDALNPHGDNFHEPFKGEFTIQKNPNADHTTLNIIWNLVHSKFEMPGKYAFEFYYDGEFRTGLSLTVGVVDY
ncbi:DUF6941 family protein [Aquirufa aurantiipilula]